MSEPCGCMDNIIISLYLEYPLTLGLVPCRTGRPIQLQFKVS